MRLFTLCPPWNKAGNNPYPWIDSADGLFGPDELDKPYPVALEWVAPRLFTSRAAARLDAYCCPGGYYAFSPEARALLDGPLGDAVQWVPVELAGIGRFDLIHALRVCSLGPGARFSRNDVSGNISDISVYDFDPNEIRDACVFRAAQPPDSAAAAAGFCCRAVLTTELPALIWERSGLRGVRFQPIVTLGHPDGALRS